MDLGKNGRSLIITDNIVTVLDSEIDRAIGIWSDMVSVDTALRRRFKCKKCQKPFSEILEFVPKKKNFTIRSAKSITQQIIHSDIKNVADRNGLTAEEVESMVMYYCQAIYPIDVSNLRKLGIDEISLVKGQGNFIFGIFLTF
jgi:transposase